MDHVQRPSRHPLAYLPAIGQKLPGRQAWKTVALTALVYHILAWEAYDGLYAVWFGIPNQVVTGGALLKEVAPILQVLTVLEGVALAFGLVLLIPQNYRSFGFGLLVGSLFTAWFLGNGVLY